MSEYKMAKGAVKVSPHTEDVRLYVVVYQPDCDWDDYYPLGVGLWFEDDKGRQVHKDSYWIDRDLAEARVRFIEESNGVAGFGLGGYYAPRVVEITATTEDRYVLLEGE
jgi:hypothetical protein|tara:strand:- start:115 stop:441 length:327 start_codon:yes stop_codon:yes gene_type:complete